MNALFIGYKNHSKRVLNLLKDFPEIQKIYVYHPDFTKLEQSGISSLSPKIILSKSMDVPSAQCAFITSPTRTHAEYLSAFIEKGLFVYCEKPPAQTLQELKTLQNLSSKDKKRVYFNFNYRFTQLGLLAKQILNSGSLGKPLQFNFISTQGIAFKEEMKNDWRFSSEVNFSGVLGNVGIHFVDLCLWLLGSNPKVSIKNSKHSPFVKTTDTSSVQMEFEECVCNILVSYAAPFINTAHLIFENGYLALDNGSLNLYSPRESFDAQGRFSTPPTKKIGSAASSLDYFNESLKKSLEFFISNVKANKEFSTEDFDLAMKSSSLLI